MTGGEAISGIRMEHSRLRKPSFSQSEGTRPGDRAFLASAAECMPPMPEQPIPEHPQAMEVSWYRIVVEVALHHRFELGVGYRAPACPEKRKRKADVFSGR
jgi:hypothetical protein